MGSIWVIKILQAHLLVLRAFVANSKIDAIYTLYPESFCDKNLAVRRVFAFTDSVSNGPLFVPSDIENIQSFSHLNTCDVVTRIKETVKCYVPDSVCLPVSLSVQKCCLKRLITQIQIINTLTKRPFQSEQSQ